MENEKETKDKETKKKKTEMKVEIDNRTTEVQIHIARIQQLKKENEDGNLKKVNEEVVEDNQKEKIGESKEINR